MLTEIAVTYSIISSFFLALVIYLLHNYFSCYKLFCKMLERSRMPLPMNVDQETAWHKRISLICNVIFGLMAKTILLILYKIDIWIKESNSRIIVTEEFGFDESAGHMLKFFEANSPGPFTFYQLNSVNINQYIRALEMHTGFFQRNAYILSVLYDKRNKEYWVKLHPKLAPSMKIKLNYKFKITKNEIPEEFIRMLEELFMEIKMTNVHNSIRNEFSKEIQSNDKKLILPNVLNHIVLDYWI